MSDQAESVYPGRRWRVIREMPLILVMKIWRCWVCNKEDEYDEWVTVPDGWRVTVRGNAGKIGICQDCNKKGKNYRKDN